MTVNNNLQSKFLLSKPLPFHTKTIISAIILAGMVFRWLYGGRYALPYLLDHVDPAGYHQLAVNLLDGRGFCLYIATEICLPNILRMPGYPLFIAAVYRLFGPEPVYIVIIQIMLDGLIGLLLSGYAWHLTRSTAAAVWAPLLHMANPNAWMFTTALLTESLLSLILTLLLGCLIRQSVIRASRQYGVLFGLLCALAIYIKPNLFFCLAC